MRIGMIGLGKLGLPVALAIDACGHEVYGYDVNPDVKNYLEERAIPLREEAIEPFLEAHGITWCESIHKVVEQATDIVFVAIQTPHRPEYEGDDTLPDAREDFDYTYLKEAIAEVGEACKALKPGSIVAVISTCLPGTFRREIEPLLNDDVRYAYTPQFIAMGTVLRDYLNPEFNLIGVTDADDAKVLKEFYESINEAPPVLTDITTAEGIKVSYNTWITAKTVIANAWGELCEKMGMNFDAMNYAWALSDKRLISPRYMSAGMSDGGGCHPRDNIALSWLAGETAMSHNIWDDLVQARQKYEAWHAEVILDAAEQMDLPIVLLGKAFKPETDIETGSAAMLLANILRKAGTQFVHENDLAYLPPAVYFIATGNERYKAYEFPEGSVVIDPFGYIPDREGVEVVRLGRP